jgi:hypothetical protein
MRDSIVATTGALIFVLGLITVEVVRSYLGFLGLVIGLMVMTFGLLVIGSVVTLRVTNIEYCVIINQPIEEVWSFMADFRNVPKWDEGVCEILEISPGPTGLGTKVVDRGYGLGYSNWHESFRVIEFNVNHTMVLSWNGSYGEAHVRYNFDRAQEGTKLTAITGGRYNLPYKLLAPFLGRYAKKKFQGDLDNIKKILENPVSLGPT